MKKNKFRILTVISIIVLCIGTTLREFQNDTFYIIKLGDYIVHNGIDMLDHYSFINGLSYTYPHWLYDVIIYLIYSFYGYSGIYISNIIFFIILVFSIYYINLRYIKNEFISSFSCISSIFLLCPFITARSQLISFILFIWEIYFILRLLDTGKYRYGFLLLLICLILANVHATVWIMYFVLFLPYIFEEFVYFMKSKVPKKKIKGIKFGVDCTVTKITLVHSKHFKVLLITMLLSIFMGVLSPSKICYTYVFKIMMGDSQSYIHEHAHLVLYENIYFVAMLLLLFGTLIFTRVKIRLCDLCMVLGLTFMALSSGRHISLFYLIGIFVIWKLCSEFMKLSGDKTLEILVNVICNKYIYIVFIVIVMCYGSYRFVQNCEDEFISLEAYPVNAILYIKSNLDISNVRIFNDYNFGSYMLFEDIPVFIDSRSDLYMDEFNDLEYDIFDDFMNIVTNYEKKFDYYNINYVLEYTDSYLSLILYKDGNYRVVYEDDYFVLFERLT